MPRALISVTDKSGVADFASALLAEGFEILSTGGTANALRAAGLAVTDVAEVTGFPEMMDGRIKTLHPKIHGGLLADLSSHEHKGNLLEAGIEPISILCVNLYAFEKTVTGPHTWDEAVEAIDIGGPVLQCPAPHDRFVPALQRPHLALPLLLGGDRPRRLRDHLGRP